MKVMVAIDESENSWYALKWVIDHMSSALDNDTGNLTLVNVNPPPFQHISYPAGPGGATAIYASTSMMESVRKAQQQNSAALLSRASNLCAEKMIKTETLILTGDPKDMICQISEEMNVDLLVLGSRGLGMIKRAFLGSVSDFCAHHSKCPILIVRPPKNVVLSSS